MNTGSRKNLQETPIVLVVDGDAVRRFCTCVYLLRLGYHVFPVEKGEDAMHLMKLTSALILITEIILPGMNGIDLLKLMKQEIWTRHVPVLIYTTITDQAYRVPCEEAGCAGYLRQSADYNKLYEAVQHATEPTPRSYVRLSTWFNVDIRTPDGGRRSAVVTAISQEGMFVDMQEPLACGTIAEFTLFLPRLAEGSVLVTGQVLYSHQAGIGGNPGIGVKFLKVWSDAGAMIRKFIRDKLTEGIGTTFGFEEQNGRYRF